MESMELTLTKNFGLTGNSADDFFAAINSMDSATEVIEMDSKNMVFYAVVTDRQDVEEVAIASTPSTGKPLDATADVFESELNDCVKSNCLYLYMARKDQNFKLVKVSISSMKARGITDAMIDELRTESKMMVRYEGKSYLVSPFAFTTLLARAGLGGDVMNRPYIGRVIEIAKSLFYRRPQRIKAITRSIGESRIIVGAHSEKYCYIPQNTLTYIFNKIAADYGNTKCVEWSVGHQLSYCYVGFPDIAADFSAMYGLPDDIMPGLCFSTSDTGDSSIIIRGFWNMKKGRVAGEVIKRNHRGELDIDKFIKDCADSIFKKYNAIPDLLCKLIEIDVKNPTAMLKSVFEQTGARKLLGKEDYESLYMSLCAEFMPSMKYTAYDIAMAIVSLPDRVCNIPHSKMEKIEQIAYKAIKADYKESKEPSTPIVVGV